MRLGTPRFARLFLGLRRPKHPIPGTGFAGVVEATGAGVTRFKSGDRVFGGTSVNFSANAEYLTVAEDGLVLPLPDFLPAVDAATFIDGPLTSLNFLRSIGQISPGQRVLINGAAGSLGTAAVQLAKHFGAEVTGVSSGRNTGLVAGLGADRVIDYTRADFTQAKYTWDLIYDAVGKSSFRRARAVLAPGGQYLSPVLKLPLLFQMLWTARFGRRKAKFSATGLLPVPEQRRLLEELVELYRSGVFKVVIDRQYSLEKVPEAHRYVEAGHKKGNVVICLPT